MTGEDAHVYVCDCRATEEIRKKITIGGVFSFEEFREKVESAFGLRPDDVYIITTTNREPVHDDESYVELLEPGDTLYILQNETQPLTAQVSERIEFQPHYDTLIKSGIYEYYASEGQVNPLPFAFAELIDNALAATVDNQGPRNIELSLNFDDSSNGSHTICVKDNGKGMTSRQLNNWAIYRLSKFNRKEKTPRMNIFESAMMPNTARPDRRMSSAPKSLNSDISWFGVGGKQAVFFIGSASRVISRPRGSQDVHEFMLSKDEFKRKEANKETIYSGFIRNRQVGDCSHIPKSDDVTRKLIAAEENLDWKTHGFTYIIITDIDQSHVKFMKHAFGLWTRQLAHIYHYYIHGPEGNTVMSQERRNIGSSDVNITVSMHERGKNSIAINLRDIQDDLESQYIRTACDVFEFKVKTDGGDGIVEGSIRYHPFLYDKETYPLDIYAEDTGTDDDGEPFDVLPARGRRPIFECFWNGRLIPYTFVDDFDWCRIPKKRGNLPNECFYRISGCLFTNDKFKVSTNKLTFIDLEGKLRDRSTVFSRVILGQEQRAQIQRQFMEWLKECHEKYDKQVKFLNFIECFVQSDPHGRKSSSITCSAYGAIEWGKKLHKKGQLVRTKKVNPVIYGRVSRFILSGTHEEDVYAVGGEFEIIQEPTAIYGDVRRFPLSKLDRDTNPSVIQPFVDEEEGKLPHYLDLQWPEGNEVSDGDSREYGLTIGAMRIEIHNRKGESIQKLPTNAGGKKLLVEQRLLHISNDGGNVKEIATHITTHGRSWPYWFKKMVNLKELGKYQIQIRTVLGESGNYTFGDGRTLPQLELNFTIKEAPPYKFIVGMLQSPLKIGQPFEIPLELQDEEGHPTCACQEYKAVFESEELEVSYSELEYNGSSVIIKGVVAIGSVLSQHGKNFSLTIILPGLERESQTLKIRLLPGSPQTLRIDSISRNGMEEDVEHDSESDGIHEFVIENRSLISLNISIVDAAGNITLDHDMSVQAKFPINSGISAMTCDCPLGGRGCLSGRIEVKKLKNEKKIKTRINVLGKTEVPTVICYFIVKPSSEVCAIEIFHVDPFAEDSEATKLKQGELDENPSLTFLRSGILPDIKAPKNIHDTKFCQIVYSGVKTLDFSFNIKPVAGEPALIRCSVVGSRNTELGIMRTDPIHVMLLDSLANKLFVRDTQLDAIKVSGEGIDESLLEKTIEDGVVCVNNIQFNQGPLGSREVCVAYGKSPEIKDYVVLQLSSGSPVSLQVMGWPDAARPYTVLSGTKMQEQIEVQLVDGWGYASHRKGVKILLGKESAVKLTPNPGMLLTDESGKAKFNRFSVTAKRGEYNLQPRAVINRIFIEGPKLRIAVLPNTETPCAINIDYNEAMSSVEAGTPWPAFTVTVTSEEGSSVSSAVSLCMAVWKGKSTKDKSVPSNAKLHRTEVPSIGSHTFQDIAAPTVADLYCVCFCLCESTHSRKFSMVSKIIQMSVLPGPPSKLQHETDPGTPTVSNTKISKTILQDLTLVLHDQYGNVSGFDIDAQVSVTIEASDECLKSAEIPIFDKNMGRMEFVMRGGKANLKNVCLRENSPGKDGAQYTLLCEVVTGQMSESIEPYSLTFLFYNDAVKQNQMSMLVKKRDMLKAAIDSYGSLFTLHKTLLAELKKTLREAETKKKQVFRDLQKYNMNMPASPSVDEINDMLHSNIREHHFLMSRPRRKCLLKEYPDKSTEVLGKIGHLAHVVDDDIACVLSWHMMGDMDCLVTFTSEKAREVHKTMGGAQQVLPLDSIYRKNLPDNNRPLPHKRRGVSGITNVRGNPVFARELLQYPKDPENCKIVFAMLLGETLILDDLESANDYRNKVVKFTYCPTILTRTGERIRSNGKFGGNQNRALSLEKLKGAVFGAPLPAICDEKDKLTGLLTKYKESVLETDAALEELNSHEASLETEEMIQKKQEHQEAVERLKHIEKRISTSSRVGAPRQTLSGGTPAKKKRP